MSSVVVKVNGIEYNLKGRENEEYLKGIAEYIDSKIQELCEKNPKLSYSAATVLAGINVADELFKSDLQCEKLEKECKSLKENHKKLEEEFNIKVKEIETLNEKLKEMENINSKDLIKEVEDYKSQLDIMEEQYKKTKEQNKTLMSRNKEVNFQLNNYKYKVLDLEKKYMDINFKLAREKSGQNILLNTKKHR